MNNLFHEVFMDEISAALAALTASCVTNRYVTYVNVGNGFMLAITSLELEPEVFVNDGELSQLHVEASERRESDVTETLLAEEPLVCTPFGVCEFGFMGLES